MWGAKSGREQLPAFPEPTHRTFGLTNRGAKQFCSDGVDQVNCRVDFLHTERRYAAHPPVSGRLFCWAVLSDHADPDVMSDRPDPFLQLHLLTMLWGLNSATICIAKFAAFSTASTVSG
jgi:hypothetical protein